MEASDTNLGFKIRAYRKKKKLSLNTLSKMTGIAASNLSSIELNKSSPTLKTLVKLADAFGVKVGALVDEVVYGRAIFCPAMASPSEVSFMNGTQTRVLTSGVLLGTLEALVVFLDSHSSAFPIAMGNEDRLLYCLEGTVDVEVDDEKFTLVIHDALYLRSETKAELTNPGIETSRILVVTKPIQ